MKIATSKGGFPRNFSAVNRGFMMSRIQSKCIAKEEVYDRRNANLCVFAVRVVPKNALPGVY